MECCNTCILVEVIIFVFDNFLDMKILAHKYTFNILYIYCQIALQAVVPIFHLNNSVLQLLLPKKRVLNPSAF